MKLARIAGVVLLLSGCAYLQKHGADIVEILAPKIECALARQDMPNDVIWRECGIAAEDIPKILPLLDTGRTKTAAAVSTARAEERAKVSASRCADAGAP